MSVFVIPLHVEPRPPGTKLAQPCPVCGKTWTPWAGSRLPCHGRCLFTPETRKAIAASLEMDQVLAERYGVTVSVIRGARLQARRDFLAAQ